MRSRCIFHIKQTRLAGVFTSVCTFPRLFFIYHNKIFRQSSYKSISKKEHWRTPRLAQQWYPFWACVVVTVDMTKLSSWQTRYYMDTTDTSSDRPRQHQELRAWPDLPAQGSDGLLGGFRHQTTFTLIWLHPSAGKMSLAHNTPAFLYIFRH